jgi:hypothetical protein
MGYRGHLVISSFGHFVTSQLVWGMINRGSTVKYILYIPVGGIKSTHA